jgi:hypothetical protein
MVISGLVIPIVMGLSKLSRPHASEVSVTGSIPKFYVSSLVLLTSGIGLVGCVGSVHLFETPVVIEHLEGNYMTLASCTFAQPAQRQGRVALTDMREQHIVRITHTKGTEKQWELAFANEDGGRQTRLVVTAADRSFPTEHALAVARACAA